MYAENTSVSVERSKAEIERLLQRYGADQFVSGWTDEKAVVQFRIAERHVRFTLSLPSKNEERFLRTPSQRRKRDPDRAYAEWEQECRRLWRSLALAIKAKLECVESGISTFETEFMAWIVLPGGRTVGEEIQPKIAAAYDSGQMTPLLPDYSNGRA